MYKYNLRKVNISKLNETFNHIEAVLECEDKYSRLYEKYSKSKSGYMYITPNESDLIFEAYNEHNNNCNLDLLNLIYGQQDMQMLNKVCEAVKTEYQNQVDKYYNDFKSIMIDEGPNASLILSLVYDDLYKNDIKLDIVQRYADVDYDIYQMLLARKALLSGLDDIEVDFIFSTKLSQDQQNEIINALRTDVPYLTIKSWIKNGYTSAQIELATRCYVMNVGKSDTNYLLSLNLDDEMTQYVKQALQYHIPVNTIKKYLDTMPLIDFKRAIRSAKQLHNIKK